MYANDWCRLTLHLPNSGTPTSTTTSLSALSTTATKDGHRGALHFRGHQHSSSSNSLEAERADRISRLAGLSGVSTLRGPPAGHSQYNANSPQTTPTSTGFPVTITAATAPGGLTPAYFDATGQPVAATKMSTVGAASATDSVSGSVDEHTTTTTEVGGDHFTLGGEERDEDMLNEMDSVSTSGYAAADAMDEDLDNLASQSVGGYEDRMSDDGSASLVGFGEGAGSTLSGPIYHRRPLPAQVSASGPGATALWGLERSDSGLSEGGAVSSPNPLHGSLAGRRDFAARPVERDTGSDTPVSQSAVREMGEARMMDGVAVDHNVGPEATAAAAAAADDDVFVDTTTRGPVPVQPAASSSFRDGRQPYPHHRQHRAPHALHTASSLSREGQHPHPTSPSTREAAERIVREGLDEGESRVGATALGSPKGNERLGRFYFEDR